MNRLLYCCDMNNGKMEILQRDRFTQAIKYLPNGRYSGVLEKLFPKRSNPQNKSYWGFAYKLLQQGFIEAGYTDMTLDNVHEWAKANCLPAQYIDQLKDEHLSACTNKTTGEVINLPFRLTTTRLNTDFGSQYLHNMQQMGAELLGVYIPDPK